MNTSLVERANLTMRMGMRRFTRVTNAYSKKLANHAYMVAIFVVFYNWCRIHTTTRVTPAMAAGLTQTLFDVEWMVKLVEGRTPPPGPRGPYKPRKRP